VSSLLSQIFKCLLCFQIFKCLLCYQVFKCHHCFRCIVLAIVFPIWIYTSSEVPTNLSLYQRKSPHHNRCVILLASYTCKVRLTPIPFSKITLARSGRPPFLLARSLLLGQADPQSF
jgi:hypothetical protein